MDHNYESGIEHVGRAEEEVPLVWERRRKRKSYICAIKRQKQGCDYNTSILFGDLAVISAPDLEPRRCAHTFRWVCLNRNDFETILPICQGPCNKKIVPCRDGQIARE